MAETLNRPEYPEHFEVHPEHDEAYHRVATSESPTKYGRETDDWHSDSKDHEAQNTYDTEVKSKPINEEFQQKFEESKSRLERTLETKNDRLTHIQESVVPQRVKEYEDRYGEPPSAEWVATLTVGAERGVQMDKQRLEFLRPSSEEDIAYRLRVMKELPAKILENTPPELPLRFHGAPIHVSRDIISSKGLSSSVDRLGIQTSYDVADQVSVTTPESVRTTLDSYSGLMEENFNVPAGCVFVVLPKSKEEADAGSSMLMSNVSFDEHPEQLFAIMTSGENVEQVKKWAQENDINPTKVKEFFEFADSLGELKKAVEYGTVNAQDYVPYSLK